MNYEQKYKEALERARKIENGEPINVLDGTSIPVAIFPELKESEGEKVRKQIISFLKEFEHDHYRSLDFSSWIAWLEKQDEQKYSWSEEDEKKRTLLIRILEVNHPNGYFKVNPAYMSNMEAIHTEELVSWLKSLRPQRWTPSEKQGKQKSINTDFKAKDCYVSKVDGKIHIVGKFEPKFKVGDWVVTDLFNIVQIKAIDNGKYILEDTMRFSIDVEYADYWWHKWTIEDAKDGDVLVSASNQPFIYNGKYTDSTIGAYIGINYDGKELFIEEASNWTGNKNVKPATKEQRDFLFQRIKEDGYEWNADEKVVNKVIIYE